MLSQKFVKNSQRQVALGSSGSQKLQSNTGLQDYWLERDQTGTYPRELHAELAKDGWIGIALPTDLGGGGLGISEATMMLQTISE